MSARLLAEDRCPRELVLAGRAEAVTDAGLLSVLFGRQNEAFGREILGEGTTEDLWRMSAEELLGKKGVGRAAAARLLACLELGRRATSWPSGTRPLIRTPEDVVRLCAATMRGLDREHFWALALNTKNGLLRAIEVSIGSLNASIVHPREVFKGAVRLSAASVVLVHNHPSGDPTPSGADLQLTRRLVRAGDVLGIDLLDHVVIGDGGAHASLREMGAM